MNSTQRLRVAVLFGGPSAEHDISVQSGRIVLNSLSKDFELIPVFLDRSGLWHLDEDSTGLTPGTALTELQKRSVAAAFLALHGPFGEDGRIQGFLDAAGLPYTGSGVLGSAMAMDKDVAKRLYLQAGLKVSPWITLKPSQQDAPSVLDAAAKLGFPLVVKPCAQGSSVGTTVCKTPQALENSMQQASRFGSKIMLEAYIAGNELTCGVLELDSSRKVALPPTLIRPKTAEFFDYGAKYQPGATEELTPAPISPELYRAVQKRALEAHNLLELRGYSRSDFIERNGELYILETNTLPGLTQTSLLPQAARAAGIELPALLGHLVHLALGQGTSAQLPPLQGCLEETS